MRDIKMQMKNVITLSGKPVSVTVTEGKTSPEKGGKPYARASMVIRSTQVFNGKEEVSETPVSFFQMKYKSDGQDNPLYDQVKALENLKTIQNYGLDAADTVFINRGSIKENIYATRNSGALVYSWQITAPYVNRTSSADQATFYMEIFILDISEETNRDGDVTGRLKVRGAVRQYGDKLDVMDFFVERQSTIDHIKEEFENNQTAWVKGFIRCGVREEINTNASEDDWGEDIPSVDTTPVHELIITIGGAYDEDFGYDPADIRKLYNVRKAYIEQLEQDAKSIKTTPAKQQEPPKYDWQ